MTNYYRFPQNIGGGIARFGGMLAALRGLMILMRWINQRQFERKLTRFLRKEKLKGEELQESSSPVISNRSGDINRRKTFNIQDEESIASEYLLD
jgi:hypothetical protein